MKVDLTKEELLWIRSKSIVESWKSDAAATAGLKADQALSRHAEAEELRQRLQELES